MEFEYYKYQGTGNDFVMIDNRDQLFDESNVEQIRDLCDRSSGIGADGFIVIKNKAGFDFEMKYFNSDGNESTMCGNGGRCIIHMANKLGITGDVSVFYAIDGKHEGVFGEHATKLKMMDVAGIQQVENGYVVDTGSPHYIAYVDNVDAIDVVEEGRKIRNSELFAKEGINVNFVQIVDVGIKVRTYERGVEDETLSCGTGCVASSIVTSVFTKSDNLQYDVETKGGNLKVQFERNSKGKFSDIWLEGPVVIEHKGIFNV